MPLSAALATLLVLVAPAAWAEGPSFTGLRTIPGSAGSEANAVSPDGSVVVGAVQRPEVSHLRQPVRWDQGEIALLETTPGTIRPWGTALAVSNYGEIVVGVDGLDFNFQPAYWIGTSRFDLPSPPPCSPFDDAFPSNITPDGTVAVGVKDCGLNFPVRWDLPDSAELVVPLPWTGFETGVAFGVSDDGEVLVGQIDIPEESGPDVPFRYVNEAFEFLTSERGTARAVSADGNVVFGWLRPSSVPQAFRWEQGTLEFLGDFPDGIGVALLDCSRSGNVAVGTTGDAGVASVIGGDAVIWDESHGLRKLQPILEHLGLHLEGWTLLTATGISHDGTVIVGTGINDDGQTEAWRAVVPSFVPEPSGWLLLLSGACLLGALYRRRTR